MSTPDSDKMVIIARYPYAGQAEIARVHLADEGINSFVTGGEVVTMDWALGIAAGDVRLEVQESDAVRAGEILQGMKPFRTLGERSEEVSQEDHCLSCGADFPADGTVCGNCGWSFTDADAPVLNEEFHSSEQEEESQLPGDTPSFLEKIRPVAKSGLLIWAGTFGMMLLWTIATFADSLIRSL